MEDIKYYTTEELKEKSLNSKEATKAVFTKLKKKKPKDLDKVVHDLHFEAFDNFDCLDCANCCKCVGPLIIDKDIERMAKHLKMKPADFMEQYIKVDEDGDYVFKESPCPFLMHDNYCIIYESRPRACREYPHTDRKRFYQILNLTEKNRETCPIVYEITEEIKKIYK
ncbi:YkgJ family cysteine cluster protein [Puteibacter caeruleilacunae]|nr:YkgJ family cysteine cluster protein [Puteibacter caeruleilacunae]